MSKNLTPVRKTFSELVQTDSYQKTIRSALSDPKRITRFVAAITSTVANNSALQSCDARTVLAGALLGESLYLSPSPQLGQYYLVPFECKERDENGKVIYLTDENGEHLTDKNGKWIAKTSIKAEFVLGYKGYIQLAMRSGQYADIDAIEIKEGEYKGRDSMTGKPRFAFVEDDDEREELPTIGYLAYYEYLNGARKTLYWSKEKMMNHADKYSAAFSRDAFESIQRGEVADKDMWKYSSFWYKDFDGMAKKTLLRQLISKWGIMSVDMMSALDHDGGAVTVSDNGAFLPTPTEADEAEPITGAITNDDVIPEAKETVKKVNLDEI